MTQTEKQNVPALRFPEFSGLWGQATLGELSEKITSGSRDWAQFYSLNGDKFIRMTNLQRGEAIDLDLSDLKFVSLPENGHEGARTSLQTNDILISITAELGKIGIVPNGIGDAYINQHTALVRPTASNVFPRFLAQNLARNPNTKKFKRLNDAGAKAGLNLGTISSFHISAPPLPEQQKIAAFLSSVDRRIAQLGQKKALLQRYKKGMMQQLFNGQWLVVNGKKSFIPPTLRFAPDHSALTIDNSPLNSFPDWEEKRLGEFNELVHGDGDWILSQDISKDGEFKIVQLGNIGLGNFVEKPMKTLTLKKFTELRGTKIYCGDLLINRMVDSNLYCCLMNKEGNFVTSVDVCWIRENQYFNNYFLMSLMLYIPNQRKLLSLSSGSGRVRISKKNLFNKFRFMLPSLKEQQKIADFLSSIDQKIGLVSSEVDHAKTFKRGLLQQMFV